MCSEAEMAVTAVVNFREKFSDNTGKVSLGRQARTSIGSCRTPETTKRKLQFNGITRSVFEGKTFYLDIRSSRYVKQIRADVHQLGGRIEDFLSKDVYCVVTDNADFKSGKETLDVSYKDSSPTTDGAAPACMTRGKAMLMKAATKDRLTSAADVLKNARNWGVSIKHLGEITALIKREKARGFGKMSPQAQSEIGDSVRNSRRKSQPHVKVKTFKTPFIKIEDTSHRFRPDHKEFEIFPSVDTSKPDYVLDSPFVDYVRDSVRLSRDLPVSVAPCKNSGMTGPLATEPKQPGIKDKPITGTFDSCKNQVNSVKKVGKSSKKGYCECCCSWYTSLHEHLNSEMHQKFAKDDGNFKSLDELILSFPGISSNIQLCGAKSDSSDYKVLTDVTNLFPCSVLDGEKCSVRVSPKLVSPTDRFIKDSACKEPSKFCERGQEYFDQPPHMDGPYHEHASVMHPLHKLGDIVHEPLLQSNETCPLLVSAVPPQGVVSGAAVNTENDKAKSSVCVEKSCHSQTTDSDDNCVDSVAADASGNKGDVSKQNVSQNPPAILAHISPPAAIKLSDPSVSTCQTSAEDTVDGQPSGQMILFVPSCQLNALMCSLADSDNESQDIDMHDANDDVFMGHNDVTPTSSEKCGFDFCDGANIGAKCFSGVETCTSTVKDDSFVRFVANTNLVRDLDLDGTVLGTPAKLVSNTPAETVLDTPPRTILDTPLGTVLDTVMILGSPGKTVADETAVIDTPAETVADPDTSAEIVADTPAETVVDTPSDKAVLDMLAENVSDAPSDILLDASPEMILDTPVEMVMDTLAEAVLKTPAETVLNTPAETVFDNPTETIFDTPSETVLDTPAENVLETPYDTVLVTSKDTVWDTPCCTVLGTHAEPVMNKPFETVPAVTTNVLQTSVEAVSVTEIMDTPIMFELDTLAEIVSDTIRDLKFSSKSVLGSPSGANSTCAASVVTALAKNTANESPSFDDALNELKGSIMDNSTVIITPDDVCSTASNEGGTTLSNVAEPCVDAMGSFPEDASLETIASAEYSEIADLHVSRVCDEDSDGYSSDTIIIGDLDNCDMTMLPDSSLECEKPNMPRIKLDTSCDRLLNVACFDEQSNVTSQSDSTNVNNDYNTASAKSSGFVSKSKHDFVGDFSDLSSADYEDDFACFKEIKSSISGVIRSLEEDNRSASEGLMPLDLSLKKTPSFSTDFGVRSSEPETSVHSSLGFARANSEMITAGFRADSQTDSDHASKEKSCKLELVSRNSSDALVDTERGESVVMDSASTGYPRRHPAQDSNSGLSLTVENISEGYSKPKWENTSNSSGLSGKDNGFENVTRQGIPLVPWAKTPSGKNALKPPVPELSQKVEYCVQKHMVDSLRQRIFGQSGAMPDDVMQASAAPPSHKCCGENCHVCSVYYQYQLMYMMQINQYNSYGGVTQFDPCANVLIPPTLAVRRACVTPKPRKVRKIRKRNLSDVTDAALTVPPWKVGEASEKGTDDVEKSTWIVKPLKNAIYKMEIPKNVTSRAHVAPDMNDCKSNAFEENGKRLYEKICEQNIAFSVPDVDSSTEGENVKLSRSASENSSRHAICHDAFSKSRLLPENDSFLEQPSKAGLPKNPIKEDSSSPELPTAEDTLNSLCDGSTSAKLDPECCFGKIRESPVILDVATDLVTSSPEISKLSVSKSKNHCTVLTPKGSVGQQNSQWAVEHSGGLKLKFCRVMLTPLGDVTKPDEMFSQSEKVAPRSTCTKRKRPVCSRTGVQYCMSGTKRKKRRKLQFE
ncbi:uncharacterized protein LOC135486500 [Lineus longissimus]|uniref:uncharacterized protein LOC135486500 n=1 Tax=Lineus longissimus TaxID=88925 RepID=UPI00315D5590